MMNKQINDDNVSALPVSSHTHLLLDKTTNPLPNTSNIKCIPYLLAYSNIHLYDKFHDKKHVFISQTHVVTRNKKRAETL